MKKKDSTNKLGSQLNSNEGVENITASEISGGNNKTFNQKREFLYKRAFYEVTIYVLDQNSVIL